MATFPTFANGVSVHLPYTRRRTFRNVHNDMEYGGRYSFNTYAFPLMSWDWPLRISDDDLTTLKSFWDARSGALETFEFTDPETATLYTKVRFDQESLDIQHAGPNENVVRIQLKECR